MDEGVRLSGGGGDGYGCGGLNLSPTRELGHSQSGTGGFLYTAPSPSPTAPSCSLRLSADAGRDASGPGNGPRGSALMGKGKKLQLDGSTGNGNTSNTPVRRQAEPAAGVQMSPISTASIGGASSAAGCTALSPTIYCEQSVALFRHVEIAPMRPAAAHAMQHTSAADGTFCGRSTTANDDAEAEASPLARARAAKGSGEGLFVALLDNISLSQIYPSQGTQGTTGAQEVHIGETDYTGSGGNKPSSLPDIREGGTRGEEEKTGVRHRPPGSVSPIDNGIDVSQGGFWSRSRLGLVGSLELQDSEGDAELGLGLDAHAPRSPPSAPCQPHSAPGGWCRRTRKTPKQRSPAPQPPCSVETESIGPHMSAPAREHADACPTCPVPSPPAAAAPDAPASSGASAAATSANTTTDAGGVAHGKTSSPGNDTVEAPSMQHENQAGLFPAVGLLNSAGAATMARGSPVAGEGKTRPGGIWNIEGIAARDADEMAKTGSAATEARGTGVSEGGAGGGKKPEDSPSNSMDSSLNLDLSLTPERENIAAAQAGKAAPAEPSVRDSTDSCLSSLCLDLPSSCPLSNGSRASATKIMSPPLRGAAVQPAATATRGNTSVQRRDGCQGPGSTGERGSNSKISPSQSDSPWSLRALSSAELSPLSYCQTRCCSRGIAGARAGAPLDSPQPICDDPAPTALKNGRVRSIHAGTPTAAPSIDGGAATSFASANDACSNIHNGGEGDERSRTEPVRASAVPGKTPAVASDVIGGRITLRPGAREEDMNCSGEKGASVLAQRAGEGKLPETGAEEDDEETEDLPPGAAGAAAAVATPCIETDALESFRDPGQDESLKGDITGPRVKGRTVDELTSVGATRTEHAQSTGMLAVSGSVGSSGGAHVSSTSGDVEVRPKGSSLSKAAVASCHLAFPSVKVPPETGSAVAAPNQDRGRGDMSNGSSSDSDEKPVFTDGAAAMGLTNWAAGVCGRRELLSYPRDRQTAKESESGCVVDAARGGQILIASAADGDPAAGTAPREVDRTEEGALATTGGERSAEREKERDDGPPRRVTSQGQGPKRAASSTGVQQQLVFTSEEESGGKLAPGDAEDSFATDPSPGKLFATPPPPLPIPASASVAADQCCEDADPAKGGEPNPDVSLRVLPDGLRAGGVGEGETEMSTAKANGSCGKAADTSRSYGEVASTSSSPPRSPAVGAKNIDFHEHPPSPLILSPDATLSPRADIAGAVISPAQGVQPSSGSGAPRRPFTSVGKMETRATAGAASRAPATGAGNPETAQPAASAPLVPARPSADGWFSRRRVEGRSDSPSTPGSQASLGAGGTATQSPDLLALRGVQTATVAAAKRGRTECRGSLQGRPLAAGGHQASYGFAQWNGGRVGLGEAGAGSARSLSDAAILRSKSAPYGCGAVSSASGRPAVAAAGDSGPVQGENSARRQAARGGKAGRGDEVVREKEDHARRSRSRDLSVGGGGDQEATGMAPPPPLEAISPDEIEATPPIAAPKKRLKARKLAEAAAAAEEAEAAAVVPLPAATVVTKAAIRASVGEGTGVEKENDLGELGQEGRDDNLKRYEEEEWQRPEPEEEEQQDDDESATLIDTETERETYEPVAPFGATGEDNRRRHLNQQHRERQRGAGGQTSMLESTAVVTGMQGVEVASKGGNTVAATSTRAGLRSKLHAGPGEKNDPPAAAHSRTRLSGGVSQPPVQPAGCLFYFWHQARVQLMLTRRRRERAHASLLAARLRWNKARKRKGTKLVGELRQAKARGAPLGAILAKLSALRKQEFRYGPFRDSARNKGGKVAADFHKEMLAEMGTGLNQTGCLGLERSSGSGDGSGRSSSSGASSRPPSRADVGDSRRIPQATPEPREGSTSAAPILAANPSSLMPGRRRYPTVEGGAAPGQPPAKRREGTIVRTLVGPRSISGLSSRDDNDASGEGDGPPAGTAAASVATAAASVATAAAGRAAAAAAAGRATTSLAEACSSSAPVRSPTSRSYGASSGERIQRATTPMSPPRAVPMAIDAEGAPVGAVGKNIPSGTHGGSRFYSRVTEKGPSGSVVGATKARDCTPAPPPCKEPTADQMNDPVFRGKMKMRAKAAAAANSSAGSGAGGVFALTSEGKKGKNQSHQGERAENVGRRQGSHGGGERRDELSGWMSTRRRDWALDDPCYPAARSSGFVAGSSSSSQRPSRSKTTPAKSGAAAATMVAVPATRVNHGAEKPPAVDCSLLVNGARPATAVDITPGRGRKRGADVCGAGSGGGDSRVHGGDRPPSAGVGPRSHARKKRRGDTEDRVNDAEAFAAAAAAAVQFEKALTSLPSPKPRQNGAAVRIGAPLPGEITPQKSGRQPLTRKYSTAAASSAIPLVLQEQRSRGHRGQEMVRQASALAAGAASALSEKRYPRRDSPPGAAGIGPFSGLSFVLVGLPDKVDRDVECKIVADGGRILEDIPLQPRDHFSWLPRAGAEAASAADAARRGKARARAEEEIVVVLSVPSASRLPKYVLAIAMGTPLLHHFWVSDSAVEARALPAAPYLLPGAREASRRRQALAGAACGDADGGARRASSTMASAIVAAKAGNAARAALANVVTTAGTPLLGMAIGVAHASPSECESWGKVLSAAGAQTVRRITGSLLLPKEETPTMPTSPSKGKVTRSCSRARTAGVSPLLQAELVGLDCVLCDYPGAWSRPSYDGRECAASALRAGGKNAPLTGSKNDTASWPLLSSLGLVVKAAKLRHVPVVSLSWAVDCVVRGTRVRQQARPEYLTQFLDDSMSRTSCFSASRARDTRLRVIVSRSGFRYEVNDHVRFRSGVGGGRGNSRSGQPQTMVGRIVQLERAGGSGGQVFATLEVLQVKSDKHSTTGATLPPPGGGCGTLSVGCGGGFASPSTESSVSRGRARRARELKKVVLADETGTRACRKQGWEKVEASDIFLLGRVSVLSAREFDARRGYCGRDPDVYAQQRANTSRANPL